MRDRVGQDIAGVSVNVRVTMPTGFCYKHDHGVKFSKDRFSHWEFGQRDLWSDNIRGELVFLSVMLLSVYEKIEEAV